MAWLATRRGVLNLAAGGFAGLALPGWASAVGLFPAVGRTDFLALDGESAVGRHSLVYRREAGDFVVRVDSEIDFPLSGGQTHAFRHHSEEIWRDGWLHDLVSDSIDGPQRWQVRAERAEGALRGFRNGLAFAASGFLVTTALWHRDSRFVDGFIDSVDGRVKLTRVYPRGKGSIKVAGRQRLATHYSIVGEVLREAWYDETLRLVRLALPGPEGGTVVLETSALDPP